MKSAFIFWTLTTWQFFIWVQLFKANLLLRFFYLEGNWMEGFCPTETILVVVTWPLCNIYYIMLLHPESCARNIFLDGLYSAWAVAFVKVMSRKQVEGSSWTWRGLGQHFYIDNKDTRTIHANRSTRFLFILQVYFIQTLSWNLV